VIGAVGVCFLATIYPSRQAAKLDPAQALRYE
jgi:lipoprotein-releasing system permease protein